MFCSDPLSDSHFILQTSKSLLKNATAVTLGQGHGKVIQYISPDPFIVCAKYQRFSSNGLDMRGKSFTAADTAETSWKHKVIPDRGDLIRRTYESGQSELRSSHTWVIV